jgi:hypothetical protein
MNFTRNYSNNKRSASPRIINNNRIDNYYYKDENPNILYNNINIKEELLNPQYQNCTNPMNYIHNQGSIYADYIPAYNNSSNNYYSNRHQQTIYYDQVIPPSNKYIYTDGNIKYNYFPQMMPRNYNNKSFENASEEKIKKDKNKNGIKLSIINYETQYPMTFFSAKPSNKKKTLIQNYNNNINNYIVNTKESDNSYSKNTECLTTKNCNLAKKNNFNNISENSTNLSRKKKSRKKDENNERNEDLNLTGDNFHKKHETEFDFNYNSNYDSNLNTLTETHYEKNSLNFKKINAKDYYKNRNTRGRFDFDDERNMNKEDYYNYKHSKYNLIHKKKNKKKIL